MLLILSFAVSLGAPGADGSLLRFEPAVPPSWNENPRARDGSRAYSSRSGTRMVFRIVDGRGMTALDWFRERTREARAAAVVPIDAPESRRLSGREWIEASFRSSDGDRGRLVATVASVTECGPWLLEAYLRGNPGDVARDEGAFTAARRDIALGPVAELRLEHLEEVAIETLAGTWRIAAAASGRSDRPGISRAGELLVLTPEGVLPLAASTPGAVSVPGSLGPPRPERVPLHPRGHTVLRVRNPAGPGAFLQDGDILFIAGCADAFPPALMVLRSAR